MQIKERLLRKTNFINCFYFFLYFTKLIETVSKEKRASLFNSTTRVNLFYLCDKWSGRFSITQNGAVPTNTPAASQPTSTGLLSLRFSTSSQAQSSINNAVQVQRSSPGQVYYTHQNHFHHHKCYHFYDELELAATRACAEILCCGDTYEKLSFSSPNSTLTTGASLLNRNSVVFTWLSQLLENANVEMKLYEACKCSLPNEIYTLALNVCVQLLDLSLYRNASSGCKNNYVFEWVIQKCYSSLSQEIADLCFIALARVYIAYSNDNLISMNKSKVMSGANGGSGKGAGPTSPTSSGLQKMPSTLSSSATNTMPQQCLDSVYLSELLNLTKRLFLRGLNCKLKLEP